ncbi:SAM-dependent methyltransferase [Lewinellaceae bacterium SD302]|nr:SAM-dependent methyltransferase [Lewinellaceae bacterium SD302]
MNYWQNRYENQQTGWDIGYPSTPLKEYIDQLTDRSISILIPGAGNAYEAEYLWRQGFQNVTVVDIAKAPLENLAERLPDFPPANLIHTDFYEHQGQYDLILEQTFFCALPPGPENRQRYAKKMHELLKPGGKLVGLLFDFAFEDGKGPPHGGSKTEYLGYLEPSFNVKTLDRAYNSIKPRAGKELFLIGVK